MGLTGQLTSQTASFKIEAFWVPVLVMLSAHCELLTFILAPTAPTSLRLRSQSIRMAKCASGKKSKMGELGPILKTID